MKGDAEKEKILTYLLINGKFKHYNEIEGSNPRLCLMVRELFNQGALTKDNQNFYIPNSKKWPEFAELKSQFDKPIYELQKESKGNINFSKKENFRLLLDNVMPRKPSEKMVKKATETIKKLMK